MKKSFLILAVLIFSFTAQAEAIRLTNPSAIAVELGGRAFTWSVNFDRVVSDDWSAGVGFGTTGLNDSSTNSLGSSTSLIPIYINYYFAREGNSLYLTGGATIVTNTTAAAYSSAVSTYSTLGAVYLGNSVIPNGGIGFESRADAGFLIRITGYAIYSSKLYPWLGASLGYSF